ncbi:DUF3006 domain-containing protein [Myxococcaceae bacterium GXIMD 01537]
MAGVVGGVLGAGPVRVDVVEEARALVVDARTGRARTVERAALPRGAREGDVVVDGRLDPELRARLEREVAERRARLAVPVPPDLEL